MFPIVGFFIGLILILSNYLFIIFLPVLLRDILVLCAWIGITGGLHLDGFIDCCDALFAAKPPQKRLQILKDTSVGAFGIIGVILLILLKLAALYNLPLKMKFLALLFSPVLGRSSMVYAIARYPYAREHGLGRDLKDSIKIFHVVIAWIFPILVGFGIYFISSCFWVVFIFIFGSLAFIELFGIFVLKRVPGFTGDVYGALCEMIEVFLLVGLNILWRIIS